jgi:hypothetical protein
MGHNTRIHGSIPPSVVVVVAAAVGVCHEKELPCPARWAVWWLLKEEHPLQLPENEISLSCSPRDTSHCTD